MTQGSDLDIQYEVNGLQSLREIRDATSQPMAHSHNEIEVLLLERGSGTWLMGGEIVTFKPRQLVVFWAVRPHQLIKSSRHTIINCLTVPLTVFNEWQLPESISQALLAGNILVEPDASFFNFDKRHFANWHQDLKSADRIRQKLALLEIEARLGRLAFRVQENPAAENNRPPAPGLLNHNYFRKISQIADYVSRHFAEPLTIPAIAKAIDIHPTSATKMFKKICGMNLIHYLTQHRILHAQRLLATTDMKILDIALASGYRSASRFYAAFKEFCGGFAPGSSGLPFDLRKDPPGAQERGLAHRQVQGLPAHVGTPSVDELLDKGMRLTLNSMLKSSLAALLGLALSLSPLQASSPARQYLASLAAQADAQGYHHCFLGSPVLPRPSKNPPGDIAHLTRRRAMALQAGGHLNLAEEQWEAVLELDSSDSLAKSQLAALKDPVRRAALEAAATGMPSEPVKKSDTPLEPGLGIWVYGEPRAQVKLINAYRFRRTPCPAV